MAGIAAHHCLAAFASDHVRSMNVPCLPIAYNRASGGLHVVHLPVAVVGATKLLFHEGCCMCTADREAAVIIPLLCMVLLDHPLAAPCRMKSITPHLDREWAPQRTWHRKSS